MRNLPVHWSEGMLVRPHHFQAAERYWTERCQISEQWDHQYNYGLRAIEFSKEALANHQFQVHVLQARMKDGTLVSLDSGQEPDRVDLNEAFLGLDQSLVDLQAAFAQTPVVRVYLAVPKLEIGKANVGRPGQAEAPRFLERQQTMQDESLGGNDQELAVKALNVRLVLSTQDLSGYELLCIAQIQRAGEEKSTPEVDRNYIPPVLAIDGWPALGRDIVRAIYDVIGKKIEVLSQQVINRGMSLDSRDPGDLDRILMLSHLNSGYSALEALAFASGVHPFVAYTELSRLLGNLAIFGKNRRPPAIPRYDHDDLGRIFHYLRDQIEALIHVVRDYDFEQRYFVGVGLGMQVTLEPKWFNSDWQWYVGVNKGDLSEKEIRDLLSPGQLDWKLGSSRQVETLFTHRAEGLHLSPLERAPRALPLSRDWIYYEVSRKNTAWRDVQETQTLAMRLKDSLILNQDRLQGERTMEVASRTKHASLQFALFAVPNRL